MQSNLLLLQLDKVLRKLILKKKKTLYFFPLKFNIIEITYLAQLNNFCVKALFFLAFWKKNEFETEV